MTTHKYLVVVECEVQAESGKAACALVAEHLARFIENAPDEIGRVTVNKGHRLYDSADEMIGEADEQHREQMQKLLEDEASLNYMPPSASGGC